ncbi:hypothetical protein MRBL20_001174 [Peribacillus frigoritolerans]
MGAFLHFDQRSEKNHIRGVCNILRGFFNDEIVHLSAGDIISLKLFGLVAIVVLTGGGICRSFIDDHPFEIM